MPAKSPKPIRKSRPGRLRSRNASRATRNATLIDNPIGRTLGSGSRPRRTSHDINDPATPRLGHQLDSRRSRANRSPRSEKSEKALTSSQTESRGPRIQSTPWTPATPRKIGLHSGGKYPMGQRWLSYRKDSKEAPLPTTNTIPTESTTPRPDANRRIELQAFRPAMRREQVSPIAAATPISCLAQSASPARAPAPYEARKRSFEDRKRRKALSERHSAWTAAGQYGSTSLLAPGAKTEIPMRKPARITR